ncbi:MAG: tripartite tricarboxylate transporter substrate binding protein [Burkholderiales bacterium]|nr:tripartite tricarboxylate transporter substrate binding protein [Burkholderiales bacterium]
MLKIVFVFVIGAGLLAFGAGITNAQDFPTKPIRILTSAPGGSSDFVARVLSQQLAGPLGQPVIIDNRAGGVVIARPVSQAAPDGYTLLLDGATMWLPTLLQQMPYDPIKDFSPVTLAAISPNVLVVHPSLPVNSVPELIAFAKSRPGQLNYGATPPGGSLHLSMELFNAMAGVEIVRISYKGAGPAVTALVGGHVALAIPSARAVVAHVKSGRLKALGVTTSKPSPLMPGLPTLSDAGLPGYESTQRTGIFAPAGTPATVITRLNQEMARVLKNSAVRERMLVGGIEPVGSTPEELAEAVTTDLAKWAKIIKDAGIRIN